MASATDPGHTARSRTRKLANARFRHDPLHAIDEPAAHAAARTHPLPSVSTGQHAVDIEATRCSLRRCEASLLANCWRAERVPGVVGNRGLLHRS